MDLGIFVPRDELKRAYVPFLRPPTVYRLVVLAGSCPGRPARLSARKGAKRLLAFRGKGISGRLERSCEGPATPGEPEAAKPSRFASSRRGNWPAHRFQWATAPAGASGGKGGPVDVVNLDEMVATATNEPVEHFDIGQIFGQIFVNHAFRNFDTTEKTV